MDSPEPAEISYSVNFTPGGEPFAGAVEWVRGGIEALLGYGEADFMANPSLWISLIHPADVEGVIASTRRSVEHRSPIVRRYRMRPRENPTAYVWLEDVAIPRFDDAGHLTGQQGVARDITGVVADGERLMTLARAVEQTADHVFVTDPAGRILWANPAFEAVTGYSLARVSGRQPSFLKSGYHDVSFYRSFWETILSGTTWKGTFVNRRADGSVFYEEKTVSPIRDGAGEITHFVSTGRDITHSIEMVGALQESEERYREVFENANDVIFTTDLQGKFTSANAAAERLTGHTPQDILKLNVADVVAPEYLAEVAAWAQTAVSGGGGRASYEMELVTKAGERVRVEVSPRVIVRDGTAAGVQGIARDVSDRWRAEQALLRAQKAESLGVLAGGIAHDFNNLLVGILGNAGLALAELPEQSTLRPLIADIERAGVRAADLARQMLAYAGKGTLTREPLDLNALAAEMTDLLRASIARRVALQTDLAGPVLFVEGDPTQLRQVLMNLVINAADAIGDREGQIAVRTGTRHLSRRDLARAFAAEGLREGDYAFVEVQDDGAGMTAEVQQKIFDPFFTTKLTGRGLGLAATLGIIRGHRGAISVESEVGRGTTFTILLPPLSTSAPAPASGGAPDAAASRVEGMALVIDDDDTVRAVVRRILERQGLRVLDAPTGEEGIELATQHGEQVKLVLLDLTMPGMGGEATLRRLRALWPELPVILMSGYAEDDVRQRLGAVQIQGIIEKPFDITSVQAEVERALRAAPG